jgi:hypothetical protein
MHAEMQEEWKHSIAPAQAIDPHPLAGNRRINITYRDYKPNFHPNFTPRCKCSLPAVVRTVQRKKENRGKYFWSMIPIALLISCWWKAIADTQCLLVCYGGNVPGKENCSFFQWADFDDDGIPIWDKMRYKSSSAPAGEGPEVAVKEKQQTTTSAQ